MSDTIETSAPKEETVVKVEKTVEKSEKDATETEKVKSEEKASTVKEETEEKNGATISESAPSEPSALEQKIIRQIEYYFGDANLARDKFLNEEIKKDNGWVTLVTLLTFNRLKSLSEDPAVIMTALRKSSDDLLELKDDESSVRRNTTRPVPSGEEHKKLIPMRQLYVKGFPVEMTLDDLIEFFEPHGGESVMLRYDAKKNFKGSVFILFKTPEQAKTFIDAPEMKYKDTVLTDRLYRNDYWEKKNSEKNSGKQDEVKRKEDQKKKREQEEKEELQSKITRGSILKVSGIEDKTEMVKIKEFFGKFGKVAWVDFGSGDKFALVRYATANEATTAWEKAQGEAEDGKVKLDDKELSATVLEGEEEEAHWKTVFESIHSRFSNKRGGGKFGGRGRGRGNKRRGGYGRDGPSEKRSRADD